MYPLRSFLILLLFFFGLSFIGEFIVGPLLGDAIPLWKIAAVSLITALSSIIPLHKRGLKPGDVFKYFKRTYVAPKANMHQLIPHLRKAFSDRDFHFKWDENKERLRISRKANWQSFGEVLYLRKEEGSLKLFIRPKFYLDVFDQGQAHESLLNVEQIINKEAA